MVKGGDQSTRFFHNVVVGRNILDGVLVVNEVINLAKRDKRSCLALKVDYEKAYDSVSWNYLRSIMGKMGFGGNWSKWMKACVFISSMSVLVNGSVNKDFMMERGLRQGDLLSPFLFVIAMEGLTCLVNRDVEIGEYEGFSVYQEIIIDILQFVDDTIILRDGFKNNLWSLKAILRGFEMIFGLRVSFHKSNIFGIHMSERSMLVASSFLSSKINHFPCKYF